jgi:soluble cytochrome b562
MKRKKTAAEQSAEFKRIGADEAADAFDRVPKRIDEGALHTAHARTGKRTCPDIPTEV